MAATTVATVARAARGEATAEAPRAAAGSWTVCEAGAATSGISSKPGANSAARSSDLVGEGGGEGVGVWAACLVLPLGRRAVSHTCPCHEGSLKADGDADLADGTGASLRGLPLSLAGFAAAVAAAASTAASAGVLH